MPEEKVSSVQIPKNAGELANNWDKHEKVSDPQRGQWVQRCVTWSFPHQCCIQPLPPAADAGPRQPVKVERSLLEGILNFMNRRFDGDRLLKHQAHFIGELHRVLDVAAPPVPQAAPRECDCEECASRLATAPDSAMRVAREITTRWQKWQVAYAGNFAGCDTHGGPVPPTEREVAALIRQAGSERERELATALTNLVEAIDTGRGTLRRRAEASRLLGGESK